MKIQKQTALIGVGYWGKNLARNLNALNALHTICDISQSALTEVKGNYPEAVLTSQYGSVLSDPHIQSIVIATPAPTHYELAKQALLAGKDVYVEKPLSLNFSEGEELLALARSSGRVLMAGHILQYHPCVHKLKQLITEGVLGDLHYISSHRLNLGKICTEENALWSYAPHDIAMILSLVSDLPLDVRCVGGTYLKSGVADTTLTTLSFANNIQAHVYVSWLNPFKEQKLSVVGSKAMVVFDDTKPWEEKLTLFRNYLPNVMLKPEPLSVEQKEPLREECSHFLHCCATREEPQTGGESALRVLQVLQAAQESLDESGELKSVNYLSDSRVALN